MEIPLQDTMAQAFDRMAQTGIIDTALADKLKKAVGFRNIAVHNYDVINWHIVYALCTHQLDDLRDFARAVVQHVEQA